MSKYLKQSTAGQTRTIGPFVDDTDFKTAEDGLTIANTDIRVKKNGAADVAKNSGGGTADVNGQYAVTWDATDTDTVGELHYSVKVAGALQVFGSFAVLEEAVYDALFGANALGYVANAPVNVAQLSGDTTAADNAEAFFDGTGYAGTGNVIPTVTTLTGHTAQTGDSFAIVNSGTHGNAAIKGFVDDIGTAGAGLTAVPWNAAWDAEVQSEATDALNAYDPPTYTELLHFVMVMCRKDAGLATDLLSVISAINADLASGAGAYANTTDAQEALRDNVGTAGAAIVLGSGALVNVTAWTVAITGNITGNLSGSVGSVTGAVGSISGVTFPTNFAAMSITAGGIVKADLDTIKTQTVTCAAGVTVGAFVGQGTAAIGVNASGHISRVVLVDTLTTLTGHTPQTGDVYSAITSALADSIPADGTRPSLLQASYMICQGLFEGSISGTTWTVKKVDASTTLFTVTLDSATTPTSKTRAT